jgi:hypothetical protein
MSYSFSHWFAKCRNMLQQMQECYDRRLVKLEHGALWCKHPEAMQPLSNADMIQVILVGSALSEGPKVFRPTQLELETCELVDINIDIDDYQQPFGTVILELPDKYVERCEVVNPMNGLKHQPFLVLIRKDLRTLYLSVAYDDGTCIQTVVKQKAAEFSLEQAIQAFQESDVFPRSLPTSQEEWELQTRIVRATINYCLLIDEVGSKRKPDSPHRAKLLRSKNPVFREQARTEPVYYELNQVTVLHETEHSEPSEATSTGTHKRPHHRRGHYRMQPYGPNSSLRKRIRIPPKFINARLFVGQLCDAKAQYRTQGVQ